MGRCAGWLGQAWRLQCRSQGRCGLDVIPVAALITCPQWHGVAVHTLRGVVLSPLWHNITWQRSVGRGSRGTAEIGAEACLRGHD